MNIIQHAVITATLVLFGGTAMAETVGTAADTDGFHALSQINSSDTSMLTSLTDERLRDIVGGVTHTGNPPQSLLFATETGNPQAFSTETGNAKGNFFGTETGNPSRPSGLVSRLNGGLGYPNPLDPDRPWGPIGPVVKRSLKLNLSTYHR